jgi:hypothetical protein
MFLNKITLAQLSSIMFEVYSKTQLDMGYYEPMFNGLISEMGFGFKKSDDLKSDLWLECENDFKGDSFQMFLDKINRMDINEKIFYNIAFEFIEPMKVEGIFPDVPTANILIPNY